MRSTKSECLSRIVPLGEGHLRRAVAAFVTHYHRERNHQGLESKLIDPEPGVGLKKGQIVCRERLGGLLRFYYRLAA